MRFVGVKEVSEKGEIPESFIKPQDVRVMLSEVVSEDESIPVIDLSAIDGEERASVVKAIADAASKWGFFQIINHGVPVSVMESMTNAGLGFFDLPLEEKMDFFSEDPKNAMRFCTSFSPSTEDHLDWNDNLTHQFPPYAEDHPWPVKPVSYKKAAANYLKELIVLGGKLLAVLSEGLGLDAGHLARVFGEQAQSMRLNLYPPCPRPEIVVGISSHSDFSGFTILLQDQVGGLQVKNGDVWYSVKPIENSFVFNISDQLQILSNGKYQSAEHRVAVSSSKQRMSIAMFFKPSLDMVAAPIPELLSEENPPRYRASLFRTYLEKQFSKKLDSKNDVNALIISTK